MIEYSDEQGGELWECTSCSTVIELAKPKPVPVEKPKPQPKIKLPESRLEKCRVCNGAVSRSAWNCPHCGDRRMDLIEIVGRIVIAFLCATLLIGFFLGVVLGAIALLSSLK